MADVRCHPQPVVIVLALLMAFATSGVYGQGEEIVLDNPEAWASRQRTAVTFSHEAHLESFECLACHHVYEEGENVLDEDDLEEGNPAIRCAACHDSGSRPDLKGAFHLQCIGCHRTTRIDGQASGPELCGECHIK